MGQYVIAELGVTQEFPSCVAGTWRRLQLCGEINLGGPPWRRKFQQTKVFASGRLCDVIPACAATPAFIGPPSRRLPR